MSNHPRKDSFSRSDRGDDHHRDRSRSRERHRSNQDNHRGNDDRRNSDHHTSNSHNHSSHSRNEDDRKSSSRPDERSSHHRDRDRDRDKSYDRERDRDSRPRDYERPRERSHEHGRNREQERGREREQDRNRGREKERNREHAKGGSSNVTRPLSIIKPGTPTAGTSGTKKIKTGGTSPTSSSSHTQRKEKSTKAVSPSSKTSVGRSVSAGPAKHKDHVIRASDTVEPAVPSSSTEPVLVQGINTSGIIPIRKRSIVPMEPAPAPESRQDQPSSSSSKTGNDNVQGRPDAGDAVVRKEKEKEKEGSGVRRESSSKEAVPDKPKVLKKKSADKGKGSERKERASSSASEKEPDQKKSSGKRRLSPAREDRSRSPVRPAKTSKVTPASKNDANNNASKPQTKKEIEAAKAFKELLEYCVGKGIKKSALTGWKAVLKGEYNYEYFYADSHGNEYSSKSEVRSALQADGMGAAGPEEGSVSREHAHANSKKFLEKEGDEVKCLVGPKPSGAPVVRGDLRLISLGSIEQEHGYHDDKHIWPVGYQCTKVGIHGPSGQVSALKCSIGRGQSGPLFRIEVGPAGSEKETDEEAGSAVEDESENGAWQKALALLGLGDSARAKDAVLGGQTFFNSTVERLIEGMDGALALSGYTFLEERGQGQEAIARRVKNDATLHDLKEKLESQWSKGMSTEDKERRGEQKREQVKAAAAEKKKAKEEDKAKQKEQKAAEKAAKAAEAARKKTEAKDKSKGKAADGTAPVKRERKRARPKEKGDAAGGKLLPAIRKEVESLLRAHRKEARAAVLSRFDADQSRGIGGIIPMSTDGVGKELTGDDALDAPPAPVHVEPHPAAIAGVRLEHIMELWNFLQTFSQPLGLRVTPTFDQLRTAILTLSPPPQAPVEKPILAPIASTPSIHTQTQSHGNETNASEGPSAMSIVVDKGEDAEEEATFEDTAVVTTTAAGADEEAHDSTSGPGVEADESKKESQALLDSICMAMSRLLVPELGNALGGTHFHADRGENDKASPEDVFTVNQLTWQELARLSIVLHLGREYLQVPLDDVRHWISAGGDKGKHDASGSLKEDRILQLLLRQRLERRWHGTASTSIASSGRQTSVETEVMATEQAEAAVDESVEPAGETLDPADFLLQSPRETSSPTEGAEVPESLVDVTVATDNHDSGVTTDQNTGGEHPDSSNKDMNINVVDVIDVMGVSKAEDTAEACSKVDEVDSNHVLDSNAAVDNEAPSPMDVGSDAAPAVDVAKPEVLSDAVAVKAEEDNSVLSSEGITPADVSSGNEGLDVEEGKDTSVTLVADGVAKEEMQMDGDENKAESSPSKANSSEAVDNVKSEDAANVKEQSKVKGEGEASPGADTSAADMEVVEEEEEEEEPEEEDTDDEEDEDAEERKLQAALDRFIEDETVDDISRKCGLVLRELWNHPRAYFFSFIPDKFQNPQYDEIVARPVALSTIFHDLRTGAYGADGSTKTAEKFADAVRLMWENCWCYNCEGTSPWVAATVLSSIFERRLRDLKQYLFSDNSPPLSELLEHRDEIVCNACGKPSEAETDAYAEYDTGEPIVPSDGVVCHQCRAFYHKECSPIPIPEAPKHGIAAEYFCAHCLDSATTPPTSGAAARRLGHSPPLLCCLGTHSQGVIVQTNTDGSPSGDMDVSVETKAVPMADTFPAPALPAALDWSLNAKLWRTLEGEGGSCVLHDAAVLLSRRGGGALPSTCGSWTPAERVIVLLALASLALGTPALHQYLSEAEQRCKTLRHKALSGARISDTSFQGMLRSVGGEAAATYWKKLVQAAGGLDALGGGVDVDGATEDVLGPTPGVCTVCWESTVDVDDSTVLMCDGCNGEVHVQCSQLRDVPPEGVAFFCRACTKKRGKKAKAAKDKPPGGSTETVAFAEPAIFQADRLDREVKLKDRLISAALAIRKEHEKTLQEQLKNSTDPALKRAQTTGKCGSCPGCLAKDCGKCKACKASAAAGGATGKKAKPATSPCLRRKCTRLEPPPIDWEEVLNAINNEGKEGESAQKAKQNGAADGQIVKKKADRSGSAGGGSAGQPQTVVCEYCGGGELQLCSTMVRGQTRAEMEAHIEIHSEGRRVPPPPLPLPYFPPSGEEDADAFASAPKAHEFCATAMLMAVTEQSQHGLRQLRERAVEEAIRLGCYRTDPIGEDRARRLYFRFAADTHPHRLYVCAPTTSSATSLPSLESNEDCQTDRVPAQSMSQPDWTVYTSEQDLKALVDWLDLSLPREAALAASLLKAFPILAQLPSASNNNNAAAADSGGDKSPETGGEANMEVDTSGDEADENSDMDIDAGGKDDEEDADQDQEGEGEETAAATSTNGARRNAPEWPPTGSIALALQSVPDCKPPPEEATVDFDESQAPHPGSSKSGGSKDGAIQFHPKHFYALAITDSATGALLRLPKNFGARVTYDIYRDGQLVAEDSLDKPFSKSDPLYYFRAANFKRTGTFTIRFALRLPSDGRSDPVSKKRKASVAALDGEKDNKEQDESLEIVSQAPPLSYTVRVTARFARTGAAAALHRLRAARHQNSRRRLGGVDMSLPAELNVPFDIDEVAALRNGLAAVVNALPRGALREPGFGPNDGDGGGVWTPAIQECWLNHVSCAESCLTLAEALLVLEGCIDSKWLRPWYRAALSCLPSNSQLLRLGTPGAVAIRLFLLDKALQYDKSPASNMRGTRQGTPRAAEAPSLPPRRATRTSMNARAPPTKPKGRQTRTSKQAASMQQRKGGSGSSEEEDDDDEGAGSEDDYQGRGGGRGRRRSYDSSGGGGGRALRRQKGPRPNYTFDEPEDDEEDDQAAEDGWICSQCTMKNEMKDTRCGACSAHRPANAKQRYTQDGDGPRQNKRARYDTTSRPQQRGSNSSGESDKGRGEQQHVESSEEEEIPERPQFFPESDEVLAALDDETADWRRRARAIMDVAKDLLFADVFLYPVDVKKWPDYKRKIQRPMDLSTMSTQLREGVYDNDRDQFVKDAEQITINCVKFNGKNTKISTSAKRVATTMKRLYRQWIQDDNRPAVDALTDTYCTACGLSEEGGPMETCPDCRGPYHPFCVVGEQGKPASCAVCAQEEGGAA